MPSTKRQRQRRERAVGEAVAAARLGEAARAHPDASLFFMDDAATETASKRARRAAKKKVATASPTESALLRKFEQRRKARPAHAGARAPKAAARPRRRWRTSGATRPTRAPPTSGRPRRPTGARLLRVCARAGGRGARRAPRAAAAALTRPARATIRRRAPPRAPRRGGSHRGGATRRRGRRDRLVGDATAGRVSEDEDEAESDSESASESESDDGGETGADGARPQKSSRSLKKGRAQRNRMKRARLQAFEKRQRDEGKRQRAAFDGLKRLRRELDEREAEAVLLAAWDSSLVRKFASDHASHTATPTAGSRQGAREGAAAEGRAADGAAGRRARRQAHRRAAVEQGHARHGRRGPARRARRGASPRQTRPAQEAAEVTSRPAAAAARRERPISSSCAPDMDDVSVSPITARYLRRWRHWVFRAGRRALPELTVHGDVNTVRLLLVN